MQILRYSCRRLKKLNQIAKSAFINATCRFSTQRQKTNHVWVSLSNNIYQNLALEDWIYQNADFEDQNVLLLWRNSSCIVVGRHQNPWVECDIATASQQGVRIARRNSGGGTVYHDLGNMCLTFFTSRNLYNRVDNLKFITSVLTKYFEIDVSLNDRDDIILEGQYKISGTAAKLSGKKSYHHCTLLLDVNCNLLNQVLNSRFIDVESRATESVRSKVKNLKAANPSINYEDLVLAFTQEFIQTKSGQPGDVHYITEPVTEEQFPGISQIYSHLKDWNWIFGKTPKFGFDRTFAVHNGNSGWGSVAVSLTIEKGQIASCELRQENCALSEKLALLFKERLVGTLLKHDELAHVFESFSEASLSSLDVKALEVVQEYFSNLLR